VAPAFDAVVEHGFAVPMVNVKQVGEDTGEHLPRAGRGEMPFLELLVLSAENLFAVPTGQHASVMERIE